jgi:hypothetical protein
MATRAVLAQRHRLGGPMPSKQALPKNAPCFLDTMGCLSVADRIGCGFHAPACSFHR